MRQHFTISQLVDMAEQDVIERGQQKTASAAPVVQKTASAGTVDQLATSTVLAMAKVARELAYKLKKAEDDMGGGPHQPKGSESDGKMVPNMENPDEFVEPTGTQPQSPTSTNPFTIPTVTSDKPGEGSMIPNMEAPEQVVTEDKVATAVNRVHQRYLAAMRKLSQGAPDSPDQPVLPEPDTGPGKPEDRPEGVEFPTEVPVSYEEVRDTTAQETENMNRDTMKGDVSSGAIAAAEETTQGALNTLLDAAESTDATKAAAFRAWYSQQDPNSKVAQYIRTRLQEKTSQAPMSPLRQRGDISLQSRSPIIDGPSATPATPAVDQWGKSPGQTWDMEQGDMSMFTGDPATGGVKNLTPGPGGVQVDPEAIRQANEGGGMDLGVIPVPPASTPPVASSTGGGS